MVHTLDWSHVDSSLFGNCRCFTHISNSSSRFTFENYVKISLDTLGGTLIKRYNRFIADIILDTGEAITSHCPNTGRMLGVLTAGNLVRVTQHPKNKFPYRLEMIHVEGVWVGVNTQWPNKLINQALLMHGIPFFEGYPHFKSEVIVSPSTRLDFLLWNDDGDRCYVEVKNVHYKEGTTALFPDSPTQRGVKHLKELTSLLDSQTRCVCLYVIQRHDCENFTPIQHLDPLYAQTAKEVHAQGVESMAISCFLDESGIILGPTLPVLF